jgi:Na+/melibiose symporter-like transporter
MATQSDFPSDRHPAGSPQILWQQVGSVAILQAAIALLWVVYNLYIGNLLEQIGVAASAASTILIVENLLAALIEPVMGSLSDGAKRWMGTQLPWISGGAIAASALFMAIPVSLTFGTAASLQTILPILVIAWAMAMAIFRTPVVALLGRYATATELPYAASLLTLVGAIAAMLTPFAGRFILSFGAIPTFSLGSFVLLGALIWMQRVNPVFATVLHAVPSEPSALQSERGRSPVIFRSLGLIFILGIGVTIGSRILGQSFVAVLKPLPVEIGAVMGGMAMSSAIAALPMGKLMTKFGSRVGLILGLLMMVGLLASLPLVQTPSLAIGMAIALGIALSMIGNGTMALALALVPEKTGLGTGLFFSGVAIGVALFFSYLKDQSGAVGGILAYAIAAICAVLLR